MSIRVAVLKIFWMSSIIFLLSGCGYRFAGEEGLTDSYKTFSVPYAEGDQQGELTGEVIRLISERSSLRYVECGSDLVVKIKLMDLINQDIGYRYARKRGGPLKHYLIPTETRLKINAEVVVETRDGNVVRGPVLIHSSTDFDHTFYTSRKQENIFSLGQLNDIDAAREAAMHPLNVTLASKIVDYLINSW